MSPLENISWERLLWDANRLRKPAQRAIHATAQERAGAATTVTEHAARDIAPFIEPRRLNESLERAYKAYQSPETVRDDLVRYQVRDVHRYLQLNIWWAEEWLRPDSPFNMRVLDEEEHARSVELLQHLAKSHVFPRLSPDLENVAQFPDAIIICEAAALGRRYLMTEDLLDETIGIQQWSREAHNAGLINDPQVVVLADEALRQWATDHPGFALETIATAFWPNNDNAQAHEVEQRVRTIVPKLKGARLAQLGAAASRELALTNDWPTWVEQMRATLPHKTRNADKRHPTRPENADRDWSNPPTNQEEVRNLRRWAIKVEGDRTTINELQHNGRYRTVKTFPAGAEHAVAEYLIEHDIEISGLPKHRGNQSGSGDGGFSAALGAAIDEERARGLAPTR